MEKHKQKIINLVVNITLLLFIYNILKMLKQVTDT